MIDTPTSNSKFTHTGGINFRHHEAASTDYYLLEHSLYYSHCIVYFFQCCCKNSASHKFPTRAAALLSAFGAHSLAADNMGCAAAAAVQRWRGCTHSLRKCAKTGRPQNITKIACFVLTIVSWENLLSHVEVPFTIVFIFTTTCHTTGFKFRN